MRRVLTLAIVLACTACVSARTETQPSSDVRPPKQTIQAHVTRVVDGDTIILTGRGIGVDGRSRLIGIDTPEIHAGTECFGREATAYTRRELEGETVLVDFDLERTDKYGRALVYVWTKDGSFFNARLAASGYAMQMTIPPNVRYAELFSRLAREARERGRGLWSRC